MTSARTTTAPERAGNSGESQGRQPSPTRPRPEHSPQVSARTGRKCPQLSKLMSHVSGDQ
jgi:hypothetical protein